MSKLYIKAPDGRIVDCPRGLTVSKVVDGAPVVSVNPEALKDGWSVATLADVEALQKSQAAAEAAALAAKQAEEQRAARLAAALDKLSAAPKAASKEA